MPSAEELLTRELDRLTARQEALRQELKELPQDYVSRKEIKGHSYFYLQHREGQSIKSQLIKQGMLEPILEKQQRKKQLKQELRELQQERRQLTKLLKKEQRRPLFGAVKKTPV